jgi:hypothetical protein
MSWFERKAICGTLSLKHFNGPVHERRNAYWRNVKGGEVVKVKELLAKLSELDSNLEVVCVCEDADVAVADRGFRLFDVNAVDVTEAQRVRLDDGTPYLKLGRTDLSERLVVLDVTADF